ncbi:hypothetical protein SNK03_008254 [Fusarium graminearum]|uniref:Chromosome 4, complete genome n=1 Tax=Gibberella zeae (strain ATCC MYA-4620 / CBS 123657 / FGSC 9075 / NRRL 31084 / PH-1) TaxID=229533 RepID=I1S843_GIBZE|nr:hypothetical protein FGSG_13019 [Fusarium graminearum PH-1]ESU13099.1 hypothetical protein FGSG_13019 [Fusarium graminearum PH-1]CEF83597.1 unnamed protein product [Fusarium graminearum]CZS72684.1 unnamed protein product [Fusarium graminearum]|eukprot:XP_011326606.1 hypothetical protein FGSG_13019 [Fusarium graminearum PH-1]
MRIISESRGGQPEFRSSNKAMSNKSTWAKTLVYQSAAWPMFMGSTFENKDHPNKHRILCCYRPTTSHVSVGGCTEKYSAWAVRQVQLVRMSTAQSSNRDKSSISSNWGHVEWFVSRRIKYIQYQTDSNGEGKTHADKVDNEWPTVGLGCVQPAAGFR